MAESGEEPISKPESPSSTSFLVPLSPSHNQEAKKDYSTFATSTTSSASTIMEKPPPRLCEICMDDVEEEDGCVLQGCKHFSCRSCLTAYLQSFLKDQSAYPVLCYRRPECKIPLIYSDVTAHLSAEEVAIFDKFSIRAAFRESSTMCPRSGCGAVVLFDKQGPATCSSCKLQFCPSCQVVWHSGKTCEEFAATRSNAAEEKLNVARLQALAGQERWFACPTCKMLIERTGGCNHLTHLSTQGCTIQGADATHFCSLCGKVLGGQHHKTEQDTGLEHFPNGLFEKCRTVLEKEAGGAKRLEALRKKQEKEQRRNDPLRRWQNSLFMCGCAPDCRVACCCPCWVGAHSATVVSGKSGKGPCMAYCCCPCIYGPYRRYTTRQVFGIRSCCLLDLCVFWSCPCLAVLQEAREYETRANLPPAMFMS